MAGGGQAGPRTSPQGQGTRGQEQRQGMARQAPQAPHLRPAGGWRPGARPSSAGSGFLAGTARPVLPAGAQKPQSWGRSEPPGPGSLAGRPRALQRPRREPDYFFPVRRPGGGGGADGRKRREGETAYSAPRFPRGAGRGPHLGGTTRLEAAARGVGAGRGEGQSSSLPPPPPRPELLRGAFRTAPGVHLGSGTKRP